jgi:type I restriction-modification system DNA methylase subunit
MTYRDQFPDYPASDIPTIPAGFSDESWCNDMCPCFVKTLANGRQISLWIDYVDEALREHDFMKRFGVTLGDFDGIDDDYLGWQSDDYAEALAYIRRVIANEGFAP